MQKHRYYILLVIINFIFFSVYPQSEFTFKDESQRAVNMNFKTVNNLIIISAVMNGEYVDFLLDTGVNKTKIFGQVKDSTLLDDAEFIPLRSLGSDEPVKAYRTTDNYIDFGPIYSDNMEVFFITDPRFDLAGKLGVDVQGIIGFDFFKNFVLRLNFEKKSLRIYQHEKFNRKLRSFEQMKFRFIQFKPHVQLPVELADKTKKEFIFLIDSGSSDAFWLFENDEIQAPENSFIDYIGYGLEKIVEGKRSKLKSARIGKYKLDEPQVAYLDASSAEFFEASSYKDGIIGNEVMRRFTWFIDYRNQMFYFKPNSSFRDNSNYDRSGLVLIYIGEEIKRTKIPVMVSINDNNNYNTSNQGVKFDIRMQINKFISINKIRPNSPASEVDIQPGDRLLKLDGKSVNSLSVQDINELLSGDEGKKMKIELMRDGIVLKREISLRSQLNSKQEG